MEAERIFAWESLNVFRNSVQRVLGHLNGHIEPEATAKLIGKSRTYTTWKFQEEEGTSVEQHAMQCKLINAQDLLSHSDWTLAEVYF